MAEWGGELLEPPGITLKVMPHMALLPDGLSSSKSSTGEAAR